jgi:hypothetical protein
MLIKFRKRIVRWFRDSDHYDDDGKPCMEEAVPAYNHKNYNNSVFGTASVKIKNTGSSISQPNSMVFTVTAGHGGIVIETRHYDSHRDDHQTQLFVIPEEKNLADEITKIITLQSLRQ